MTPNARAFAIVAGVLTAFVALSLSCSGPSDIDSARASALDLQDAVLAARLQANPDAPARATPPRSQP